MRERVRLYKSVCMSEINVIVNEIFVNDESHKSTTTTNDDGKNFDEKLIFIGHTTHTTVCVDSSIQHQTKPSAVKCSRYN